MHFDFVPCCMNVYGPVVVIVVLQVVVMVATVDEFYVIDLGISVEKKEICF